jgi:drug/metabolite transporter (DMT)-like permease
MFSDKTFPCKKMVINLNSILKGYGLTTVSVILISMAFVLNSLALAEGIHPVTGALVMFVFSFTASFLMVAIKGKSKGLFQSYKKYFKPMALMGLLNGLAAVTWFYGLSLLGPSLLAFLLRFSTVFIVILSILILKERFIFTEALGGIIILLGALLITYSNGGNITLGLIFAVVNSLLFAGAQIISKIYVKQISPLHINNMRHFFMLITILATAIATNNVALPNAKAVLFILGASLAGPVLGFYMHYKSIEIADLSKVFLIRSS